ncbi:MAG: hypothetical protein R3B60_03275 [Candidatus Paceibacterota bacterium]
MPIYIITIGIFILVSAFSYSILATRETSNSLLVDADSIASKEVMAMMDGEMGPMMMSDGTYSSEVRYEVPYGYVELMNLEVTITDGVVTDSAVDFEIANPVSKGYVDSFEQYYEDKVIGKSVADISLARVGGATLTNVAFDAALEKIKAEAAGGMMASETKDDVVPLQTPEIKIRGIENLEEISATAKNRIQLVEGPISDADSSTSNTSPYADGTYIVEQEYYAWPNLYEPMQTTITLEDGIIIDAIQKYATIDYSHSIQYQQHFDFLYKDVVIGMPLDNAPIARIGQATETTDGFNDALLAIKERAKNQ